MAKASDPGQPIPAHLASRMPAAMQKALQHAYRRQILRALHRDVQTLTPLELAKSGLVPCSVTSAAYHLRVLESAGLVATGGPGVADPSGRRFSTAPEEEEVVLAALQDTALSDRQQLGGRSS